MSSSAEIMITGMPKLTVRLHLREHLEPVDLRHDDVEQDDVERLRPENLQCLTTIPCGRAPMPLARRYAKAASG